MVEMVNKKDDLDLKEIHNYYGTQQYIRLPMLKTLVTDGIGYIMKNGYSWLVTDMLPIIEHEIKMEEFLAIKLIVNNGKAQVTIDDGNGNFLHKQIYEFTDAKKDLTLFWTDGVLMLDSEY